MEITKEKFIDDFTQRLNDKYALDINDSSNVELYYSLGSLIRAYYSKNWRTTRRDYELDKDKEAFYFSIEFLPGKMLKSNLLNLGILDTVKDGLEELGIDLDDISAVERDMALGNGGLGRLASCFMDSLASCGLPGNGNGIRYSYGLFKQKFVDGYQVELPDEWLRSGNIWEVRKENKAVDVRFGGNVYLAETEDGRLEPVYENVKTIRAIPYDTPMIGYKNGVVNNLRLWTVEIPVSEEGSFLTIEQRRAVEDITAVLYPDDSNYEGRRLRLEQEYFFVSAGLQSIMRYYKKLRLPIEQFSEKIAVHINDTHPALCVAELMRLLVDEEGLPWQNAWNITVQTMSYTNHTIMAEALEKWPIQLVKELIPRVYQIIEEIDRRFVEAKCESYDYGLVQRTRIIQNDQIHMANLAIIGSHSTNGVAKIHSDLLKNEVLHDFYVLYPERFNNKTNGIALRRWSQLANEEMSGVLDATIGDTWRSDASQLKKLEVYENDDKVLKQLGAAKLKNKERLAAYIKESTGIEVDPTAIFDVQIKRLHAYKRQLMNLMHIVKLYLDLKKNPEMDYHPRVFIFGAKAAPSYAYAKTVIKCINEVANLVNNDPDINNKLKVIFLENYNVTLAELIIPAADVSEQISLATKEASGTSNMKLMLNGAVTIATLDGANVEIKDAVGDDNIIIFGMDENEVYNFYRNNNYHSIKYFEEDPTIRAVLNAFIDGTIPHIEQEGQEIFDSLITYNDEYFTLKDFASYLEAHKKIDELYKDQKKWQKMSLNNIANAGRFSSDETVRRYAEEIWHIDPITVEQ